MLALPGNTQDLHCLQEGFASLLSHAEPSVLPAFMLWVDLKVAEFKVGGSLLPPARPDAGSLPWMNNAAGPRNGSEAHGSPHKAPPSAVVPTLHPLPPAGLHATLLPRPERDDYTAVRHVVPDDVKSSPRKPRGGSRARQNKKKVLCVPSVPPMVSQAIATPIPAPASAPAPAPVTASTPAMEEPGSPRRTLHSIISGIIKREALLDRPLDSRVAGSCSSVPGDDTPVDMSIQKKVIKHEVEIPGEASPVSANQEKPGQGTADYALAAPPAEKITKNPPRVAPAQTPLAASPNSPAFIRAPEYEGCSRDSSPPAHQMAALDFSPIKEDSPERERDAGVETDGEGPRACVSSALRQLLTSKLTPVGHSGDEQDADLGDDSRDQSGLDCPEDSHLEGEGDCGLPEDSHLDGEGDGGLPQEEKKSNKCPVCGQMFQYRSSFRRHMKVHQGIFSHVCAVCARKFTRKEHFVRHKCSRKPNKASRGANGEVLPIPGKVPKVEFPPPMSSAGLSSPSSLDAGSMDVHSEASMESSPYADLYPPSATSSYAYPAGVGSPLKEHAAALGLAPTSASTKTGGSGGGGGGLVAESRRKKSNPRRRVEMEEEEEEDPQSLFTGSSPPPVSDMGQLDGLAPESAAEEEEEGATPPPAPLLRHDGDGERAQPRHKRKARKRRGYVSSDDEFGPLVIADSAPQRPEAQPRRRTPYEAEDGDGEEELLMEQGEQAMDLSQACGVLGDGDFGEDEANSCTMSQEFTIDSGSYKVVTDADSGNDGLKKVIKVIKQGKYLKLKEEAQLIGGQLCFVCPTCGKIFHRSSNFSRHMRIHRGVYSYVCSRCSRGFFRREHFQKHKCGRRSMAQTWDRKTKADMVLGATANGLAAAAAAATDDDAAHDHVEALAVGGGALNIGGAAGSGQDSSDPGSDIPDSEESFQMNGDQGSEEMEEMQSLAGERQAGFKAFLVSPHSSQ